MSYAEVSVNSPVYHNRTFSYSIPDGMEIQPGQAVWVPFGNKILQGIVTSIERLPAVEETRDISAVIEPPLILSTQQLKLAQWISDYYLCPLFDAISTMLPPGFERSTIAYIQTAKDFDQRQLSKLTAEQTKIIGLLRQKDKLSVKDLEKTFGVKAAQAAISRLISRNLITKSYETAPARVKPKKETYIELAVDSAAAVEEIQRLYAKRAAKQAEVLEFLMESGAVSLSEVRKKTGCQTETMKTLTNKGLVSVKEFDVKRQPFSYDDIKQSSHLKLTTQQEAAFNEIQRSLVDNKGDTFLLHGATGSGKTEVYLQALSEAVKLGKRAIVLVPEISLTPQTIDRFASRFPYRVAIIHSKLSLGEQFDQWHQIQNGEYDVVIGARSAIFAPQPQLGLIVIDEEHEWTYKQDNSPRYHTRDVALEIAVLNKATVILGSATPDVSSYYNATKGKYRLLEMPERVTPKEGSPLPKVELVDLREELKTGNTGIFSRLLEYEINKAIKKGGQVILFFNRRGTSTFVQCRDCGHVLQCPNCYVSLNYHSDNDFLLCHQCNYKKRTPKNCPACGSARIKYLGLGTQKLEQETAAAFPKARLLRWDSDSTKGKDAHREILEAFSKHKADILIGTQMVAKGLDLPNVTLVGVIIADSDLNLPDFRAGERTFQLISQVAGRAGRGEAGGKVIIQTYMPDHYAVQATINHDYAAFYRQEIDYRKQLKNPPFSKLIKMTYIHANDAICRNEAERMKKQLSLEVDSAGLFGIDILGPSPAFIQRLRGRYRWQIILRGANPGELLSRISIPQGWII
ncbi:MAG TPA: primosomal protein N', partial [Dehalococcoidia bacterium]|nr:primosomal protein N' [Dehalococcoidia bacterium]